MCKIETNINMESCTSCRDDFDRSKMFSGIIYGWLDTDIKNGVDGRFNLCKNCFRNLKSFVG